MGGFVGGKVARERFCALLSQVDEAYAQMRALSSDEVGNAFRIEMAQRLETQQRVNRGLMYRVFGQIADPPDEAGCAPVVTNILSARLRIPPNEVKRRMKVAGRILSRRQLTGPPLSPELALVADALREGSIGEDHLRVIATAMDRLPSCVSASERDEVEHSLVAEALKSDAEIVKAAAKMIDEIFNPDGDYDEKDRQRRRGVTLGPQGRDGMSALRGWIDPELRSYVEACAAAVRPGRHLPDSSSEDTPDDRSPAQRCHDGIKLGLKAGIASGHLGQHRGHAVTVIARTTLAELNQAAHAVNNPVISMPGPARTGGNTALPMRDLIRMASDAIHYLAVFDEHSDRPLYLGRQKRVATVDQRIICYSRDGGCTRPGCAEPGYHCEVHHSPAWDPDGVTNADVLFFACGPDHKRVTDGHCQATVTETGRLAWTNDTTTSVPPQTNRIHHPEELLRNNPDPPPKPD
jgi:hypothetical protein